MPSAEDTRKLDRVRQLLRQIETQWSGDAEKIHALKHAKPYLSVDYSSSDRLLGRLTLTNGELSVHSADGDALLSFPSLNLLVSCSPEDLLSHAIALADAASVAPRLVTGSFSDLISAFKAALTLSPELTGLYIRFPVSQAVSSLYSQKTAQGLVKAIGPGDRLVYDGDTSSPLSALLAHYQPHGLVLKYTTVLPFSLSLERPGGVSGHDIAMAVRSLGPLHAVYPHPEIGRLLERCPTS